MSNQETTDEDFDASDCSSSFSFDEMQGIRWKIVGSGSAWPEGRTTAYFEWENGVEASFSSYATDMQKLADAWMDAHDDESWCSDPLPEWLTNDQWSHCDQD